MSKVHIRNAELSALAEFLTGRIPFAPLADGKYRAEALTGELLREFLQSYHTVTLQYREDSSSEWGTDVLTEGEYRFKVGEDAPWSAAIAIGSGDGNGNGDGTQFTIDGSFPASPEDGAKHLFDEDNSSITAKDTDGMAEKTSAVALDLFRYDGTDWIYVGFIGDTTTTQGAQGQFNFYIYKNIETSAADPATPQGGTLNLDTLIQSGGPANDGWITSTTTPDDDERTWRSFVLVDPDHDTGTINLTDRWNEPIPISAVDGEDGDDGDGSATNLGIGDHDGDSLEVTSSTGDNVTLPAATTDKAGLVTAEDKQRFISDTWIEHFAALYRNTSAFIAETADSKFTFSQVVDPTMDYTINIETADHHNPILDGVLNESRIQIRSSTGAVEGVFTLNTAPGDPVGGQYEFRGTWDTVPSLSDDTSYALYFTGSAAHSDSDDAGEDGDDAHIRLRIYQTASTAPSTPSGGTYTFSTETLSSIPTGWATTIPTVDPETERLYESVATVNPNTVDATATPSWSAPIPVSGKDGEDGEDGDDAHIPLRIYQAAATAPSTPSGGTYTFSTSALSSIPTGWSTSIPTVDPESERIYRAKATVNPNTADATATPSWSAPIPITGKDGVDGEDAASVYVEHLIILYRQAGVWDTTTGKRFTLVTTQLDHLQIWVQSDDDPTHEAILNGVVNGANIQIRETDGTVVRTLTVDTDPVDPVGGQYTFQGTWDVTTGLTDDTTYSMYFSTSAEHAEVGDGTTDLSIGDHDGDSLEIESSTGDNVTLPAATTTEAGLMTAADKDTLDDLEAGGGNSSDANRRGALIATTASLATTSTDGQQYSAAWTLESGVDSAFVVNSNNLWYSNDYALNNPDLLGFIFVSEVNGVERSVCPVLFGLTADSDVNSLENRVLSFNSGQDDTVWRDIEIRHHIRTISHPIPTVVLYGRGRSLEANSKVKMYEWKVGGVRGEDANIELFLYRKQSGTPETPSDSTFTVADKTLSGIDANWSETFPTAPTNDQRIWMVRQVVDPNTEDTTIDVEWSNPIPVSTRGQVTTGASSRRGDLLATSDNLATGQADDTNYSITWTVESGAPSGFQRSGAQLQHTNGFVLGNTHLNGFIAVAEVDGTERGECPIMFGPASLTDMDNQEQQGHLSFGNDSSPTVLRHVRVLYEARTSFGASPFFFMRIWSDGKTLEANSKVKIYEWLAGNAREDLPTPETTDEGKQLTANNDETASWVDTLANAKLEKIWEAGSAWSNRIEANDQGTQTLISGKQFSDYAFIIFFIDNATNAQASPLWVPTEIFKAMYDLHNTEGQISAWSENRWISFFYRSDTTFTLNGRTSGSGETNSMGLRRIYGIKSAA